MFVPAATAWRTASEPEWKKVPSPRFWKMCGVSVKGAIPTHCTPSPPMWVSPIVRRSMRSAMPWQPMPALAIEPSGRTVERLCGQPEQKYGWRVSVTGAGRSRSAQESDPRRDGLARDPALEPRRHDLRDPVRVELGVGGHERAALEVGLAQDARALGVVVEDVADEELAERPFLFDDEQLPETPRELPDGRRLHREEHPELQQPEDRKSTRLNSSL